MEEEEGKERLTVKLDPRIKRELKRQAKVYGVSVGAYISMMTMERAKQTPDLPDDIGGPQDWC